MTFTGRLKKVKALIPTMTDEKLTETYNDLNRTAQVLYFGAPDRVLNLCNDVIDAAEAEIKRRKRHAND